MPLQLHKECEARLRKTLRDNLPLLMVRHKFEIDPAGFLHLAELDKILPDKGQTSDALKNHLNDSYPAVRFVMSFLRQKLRDAVAYDSDADFTPIREIEGFQDTNALADEIIAALKLIPESYFVYTALNNQLSRFFNELAGLDPINVGDNISIWPGRLLREQGPAIAHENRLRDSTFVVHEASVLSPEAERIQWREDTAYVRVRIDGHIDSVGLTESFNRFSGYLKSFFGFANALGIIEFSFFNSLSIPVETKHLVSKTIGGAESMQFVIRWHDDIKRILASAKLSNDLIPNYNRAQILNRLKNIGHAIKGANYKTHVRAAEWFCDSFSHDNGLLVFIQRTVCLEILYGDKKVSDKVGVTDLLGSRVAYSVAASFSEREEIIAAFSKIYELRSQIVHRGNRLPSSAFSSELRLESLCRRAIAKEMQLIWREAERQDRQ